MAGRGGTDQLLPSLLDRLTDNERALDDESRDSRSGSWVDLRAAVLRDLESLLNTVNLASTIAGIDQQDIRQSVLNYGVPSMSGWTVSSVDSSVIERRIKEAIEAFEPRILKGSTTVRLIEGADVPHQNALVFSIEGTLWGRPMPEALSLHTQLDLEKGLMTIAESSA